MYIPTREDIDHDYEIYAAGLGVPVEQVKREMSGSGYGNPYARVLSAKVEGVPGQSMTDDIPRRSITTYFELLNLVDEMFNNEFGERSGSVSFKIDGDKGETFAYTISRTTHIPAAVISRGDPIPSLCGKTTWWQWIKLFFRGEV